SKTGAANAPAASAAHSSATSVSLPIRASPSRSPRPVEPEDIPQQIVAEHSVRGGKGLRAGDGGLRRREGRHGLPRPGAAIPLTEPQICSLFVLPKDMGRAMQDAATILHADLDSFYASVEQLLDP